jgi:hypothetical protein
MPSLAALFPPGGRRTLGRVDDGHHVCLASGDAGLGKQLPVSEQSLVRRDARARPPARRKTRECPFCRQARQSGEGTRGNISAGTRVRARASIAGAPNRPPRLALERAQPPAQTGACRLAASFDEQTTCRGYETINGDGLSDHIRDLTSLEARMDDVRAVMDAADSRHAILNCVSRRSTPGTAVRGDVSRARRAHRSLRSAAAHRHSSLG